MKDDTWVHLFDKEDSDLTKNKVEKDKNTIENDYKNCIEYKNKLIDQIEELKNIIAAKQKGIDELTANN